MPSLGGSDKVVGRDGLLTLIPDEGRRFVQAVQRLRSLVPNESTTVEHDRVHAIGSSLVADRCLRAHTPSASTHAPASDTSPNTTRIPWHSRASAATSSSPWAPHFAKLND